MSPISIIVPTYNRSQLIVRTIESVLRQSSDAWELIIVDDGSTDDTQEVVKKYLNEKIRYVKQENSGANRARNMGGSLAQFAYLSFLDSDDELFPNWVESFEIELRNEPSVVCSGTLRIEQDRETVVLPKPLGKVFDNVIGKFTNGACYVINKELFLKIGGFDEELLSGQHTEMSLRLATGIVSKQVRIVNIFVPLVRIHIHNGFRIRNNSRSKYLGARRTLSKHWVLLEKDPSMKKNYAKIITLLAFKTGEFLVSMRYLFVYFRYFLVERFIVA